MHCVAKTHVKTT